MPIGNIETVLTGKLKHLIHDPNGVIDVDQIQIAGRESTDRFSGQKTSPVGDAIWSIDSGKSQYNMSFLISK